jgi:hypothetical protein
MSSRLGLIRGMNHNFSKILRSFMIETYLREMGVAISRLEVSWVGKTFTYVLIGALLALSMTPL